MNPLLAGIVSTNIGAFLILKIAATLLIASSYFLATKTLKKAQNKTSRSFNYSSKFLRFAYAGILIFMVIVVANNLLVLLV